MKRSIVAADLFCGGGGTSTGLALACRALSLDVDLLAVNHWALAVDTHRANHPWARHMCVSLDALDPRKAIGGGSLDLLVASPECTHHSMARGGRPMNDQLRASAWHVLRWAELLRVDSILLENVPEFRSWGPLTQGGNPIKSRKGETYQAFVGALRSLGYSVEDRICNAADHGDATTRRRLFIQARRGRTAIQWPEPSHAKSPSLFAEKPWRAAREVIDWSLRGESIYARKKPLARKTLARIAEGLRRYCSENLAPFIVTVEHAGSHGAGLRSINAPIPTVTTRGGIGVCQPFVLGQQSGSVARSTEAPLPTIATGGAISLVQPFLVPNFGEREGQAPRTHSVDEPLPTVTSHGAGALVEPFLVQYNGTGGAKPTTVPLGTVTTIDRFGLVEPKPGRCGLDILFRMLQPHELAGAMGFPEGYTFSGSRRDQIRQIGNAVAVHMAQALVTSILEAD